MARREFSSDKTPSSRAERADADDLADFQPRADQPRSNDKGWPSREAQTAGAVSGQKEPTVQLHIHGPQSVAARFDAMCRADRRSRWAMLEILMNKAGED